ncbi:Hypoxanthine-guanine phosphoribosyltransferase [Portunus trituberculatus]|uniref:Hypoxanthine-guanine phosphoribosyltransferase n=1 Tax=Portunus trituberculatus TaxID=210409 RepID=A0A5B7IIY4_PORTR|nr:Hypoxanthine-guanine phosphoribosyltransferase [Portunus trituberculatus]
MTEEFAVPRRDVATQNMPHDVPAYLNIADDYTGYALSHFCVPRHYEDDLENVLIPWGLIQDRTERLARDIFLDIRDEPLTALCVLKGGYRFYTDLLDKLTTLNRFHASVSVQLHVDFIRLKSYEVQLDYFLVYYKIFLFCFVLSIFIPILLGYGLGCIHNED